MLEKTEHWPPPYTIRQSTRVKRVLVQISLTRGLEIVVPPRGLRQKAEDILHNKRSWIEKNRSLLFSIQKKYTEKILPATIQLPACGDAYTLYYEKTNSTRIYLQDKRDGTLKITGAVENLPQVFAALKKWLRQKARMHLVPWLQQVSSETGLLYNQVSIRTQSTLWGSCTVAKKISLNSKLLFLPAAIVRYVMVHELCHTVYLNHSARYWKLVSKFEPDFVPHRRTLRNSGQYIPAWLE